MDKIVICDKCGHDFAIIDNFGEISEDGITVKYFYCPECGAKYHILTTNYEMRKLIDKRVAIQNKIAKMRENQCPLVTAQKLEKELNKLISRQKKIMPGLKKRGEEMLKEVKQ